MDKTVNQKAWFFVLPVLLLVAFNAIIPLMTVVNFSVQESFGDNIFFWAGVQWFEQVLHSERFHAALLRQLLYTGVVLLIEVPLGLAIAPADPEAYRLSAAPDLLAQMLDKLVDNAVDFCPPDGEIRLCLEPVDADLLLRVENTGPLLPRQMQDQLFDSLVSVRPERGEKTHLGLGLYIVRLIAEFHGASASAGNLPDGTGVAFSIRIPAHRELTSRAKWA
jgi:signal transduction histidine kinase